MADLELGIDARRARAGANAFNQQLDRVRRNTTRTDRATRRAAGGFDAFGKTARIAGLALASIGVGLSIGQFVQLSDTFTTVNNRLKLVTSSAEEFASVQAEIVRQANANFQALDAQAELFQRVAKGAGQAGFSTREALAATDAVAKAIRLSGVSAQAAEAAITQFGQGLASGALRGDELRSVLEQTPRLATALADALGVPVGRLRELGQEGAIVTEKIIPGLIEQSAQLDRELADFAPTIDEGFTRLRNGLVTAVGDFNDVSGVAGGFGDVLADIAKVVEEDLAGSLIFLQSNFGQIFDFVREGASGLVLSFDLIAEAVNDATGSTEGLGKTLGQLVGDTIPNAIALIKIFSTELISLFAQGETTFQLLLKNFQLADAQREGDRQGAAALRAEIVGLNEELKVEQQFRIDNIAAALKARDATIEGVRADRAAAEQRRKDREAALAGIQDLVGTAGDLSGSGSAVAALSKEIQKLVEQTRSPIQEFTAGFTELQDAIAKGLPTENAQRGIAELLNTLAGSSATLDEFSGAVNQALEAGVDPTSLETFREFNLTVGDLRSQLAAFQQLNPSATVNDFVTALGVGREAVDDARTAQEQFNAAQQQYFDLLLAGIISAPEYQKILSNLSDELLNQGDILQEFAVQAARNIQSAFADFLFDPFEGGLDGLVSKFGDTLRRIASEILANAILTQFFNSIAGFGGPVGSFAQAALGGLSGRQGGGPVSRGQPVVVGERGPEIFTPRTGGSVTPNAASMEAMMPTINNTVIVDPREFTGALATPQGGRDLINAITVNKNAIKGALQ